MNGRIRTNITRSGLLLAMTVGIDGRFAADKWRFLAKFVFQTQPVKFAAMEGQFKTERHAPLRIGGWPDTKMPKLPGTPLEIPRGLSFLAASRPGG